MTEEYPNASPYMDRHGTERWRFRRKGKTIALKGAPGDPRFETSYQAAVTGQPQPKVASVRPLPTATAPKSLRAAWRVVTTATPQWQTMEPETRNRQSKIAEGFLDSRVTAEDPTTWGTIPVADLKRRHLKELLASYSDRPHAGRHLLSVIRKMVLAALDEEWIEADPSYKLSYRPEYGGWRAWHDDEIATFEEKYPVGTTPRLVYALALWQGDRRGDITRLTPANIKGNVMAFRQGKTGRHMRIAITPMLREVLDATDLTRSHILMTQYGEPFSEKSLTGRFRDWCKAAGLSDECKLHGLRKTLGKRLAESGATTRQIMDTLGHTDIKHAELYSKDAEQEMLARDGLAGVVRQFKKPRG